MAKSGYKPRLGVDIRIKPPEKAAPVQMRRCARPECALEGSHRVPKSREALNEHLWFCLEHARAHNESWDYFNGMNEDQIAAFRVDAMTGHRPTWPLGKRSARARDGQHFRGQVRRFRRSRRRGCAARFANSRVLQLQAFDMLNLEADGHLARDKGAV